MTEIRRLPNAELRRIGEIDGSERIARDYVLRDGKLELVDVDWNVPSWPAEEGRPHSVPARIREWRPLLDAGGTLWGALDGERLVGFAIYRPDLTEPMAQLAVLHVSNGWRGKGVGSGLTDRIVRQALEDGATRLYVSSAPTKATVDFYLGRGFRLARTPHPDLLALEPEDIHLVRNL